MPKGSVYEPRIIAALQQAGMEGGTAGMEEGMEKGAAGHIAVGITAAELAGMASCSRQQAYKIIAKLEQAGMVREVGQGDTGGKLYAWADSPPPASVTTASPVASTTIIDPTALQLDTTLQVVALRRLPTGATVVELESEHGDRVEIVTKPTE